MMVVSSNWQGILDVQATRGVGHLCILAEVLQLSMQHLHRDSPVVEHDMRCSSLATF